MELVLCHLIVCDRVMVKPYSYDLRQKVIQAIELDGFKKSEVSEFFKISRNTIALWLKRKAARGDFQPKTNKPPYSDRKNTVWDKFLSFTKAHGDKTQKEMAELWNGDISARTISRALKKIGFTRKKTYGYRERNEIKQQQFIEQLATWEVEAIVYVDESGMDNREDYGYAWNQRGQRFHSLKSGQRN